LISTVLFSKKEIGWIKVKKLSNNVGVIFEKETLRVYCRAGQIGQCNGQPDIQIRHDDRPTEVMTEVLKTLSIIYPSMQKHVDVIIGSPWMHSIVLPWTDYARSLQTWKSYAQAQFSARIKDAYLKIRVLDEDHGCSRIGVGIHRDFLAKIKRAVADAGWGISGIRDLLSFSLSASVDAIPDENFCFLLAERGSITCLFRNRGEWRNAVTFPRIDNTLNEWIKVGALISAQPEPEKVYALGVDIHRCIGKFVGDPVMDSSIRLSLLNAGMPHQNDLAFELAPI
jgi:hypothetical protein